MKRTAVLFFSILIIASFNLLTFSQNYTILESTPDHIILEINYSTADYSVLDTLIDGNKYHKIRGEDNYSRIPGEPWLPQINLNIGVPYNSNPSFKILNRRTSTSKNKFIIPFPENDPDIEEADVNRIDQVIYSSNQMFPVNPVGSDPMFIFRYARIFPLHISPYQFNPVTRELIFNNNLVVRIDFNINTFESIVTVNDIMTDEYLKNVVINYESAKNWISKPSGNGFTPQSSNEYWYDPNKDYFKIYLKEKGVYRITYENLVNAGVPLGSVTPVDKLEIFNLGEPVPIDIVDANGDQFFNSGDYFQFIGYGAPPSPNAYLNIYNESNVYWFSYQSDSTGNAYKDINGFPTIFNKTFYSTPHTIHVEEDLIFERLGETTNSNVDYWFWGKASAQGGQSLSSFEDVFNVFPNRTQDSNWVNLRVAMHGMTNFNYCNPDHRAYIEITNQPIGTAIWDGQSPFIFNKDFYISEDSINIFPTGNRLNVSVYGDICPTTDDDEIRINWYEFEYWRRLRADVNYLNFTCHDNDIIKFWTTQWLRDNMKIYIPERSKMITNPLITNDPSKSVIFSDTANVGTEYFCVADDYFVTVDSIIRDQSSTLRELTNGVDYIIITHPDFQNIANSLMNFRLNNFPDESIPNPRVLIADVYQIYDEFSYGLMDPFALQYFVKYAFENWQSPAPSYVVLLGDMSFDYRRILSSSRPNFIPSIPYFTSLYGQAASDNMIVAVSGGDVVPDLAIGRLSIETVEEGNVLLNKLINYPDDPSKPWKQNIMLVASGLSEQDEQQFGFNDASLELYHDYVKPKGYHGTMIFNFPEPENEQYRGGGPEIREGINEGAVLVNYYGHGGGSQWDLIFTNDDIYLLENNGRLPLILSVTCYTAHFDNQDSFGERFNKVEGRGSIGFFGSTGLTYWGVGKALNREIFKDIFINKNLVTGKIFLNAKSRIPGGGIFASQIALQTYLGDPAMTLALPTLPDFEVSGSDISLTPSNPILGDTIEVSVNIKNWGRVFLMDSVVVELNASSSDTSYQIGLTKRPNFGEKDSVVFTWAPDKGGLYTLSVKVNEIDMIEEEDHSDNIASNLFLIFNLSEPNIYTPIDGFSSVPGTVEFKFSEIGHYVNRDLTYYIEIDTTLPFNSDPFIVSEPLTSNGPILSWRSPNLPAGTYFWRARIFDGTQYGNWGPMRSFSIMNEAKDGFYFHDRALKVFDTRNVFYSDSAKSLRLNTELLAARPSNITLLNHIVPNPSLQDSLKLTAMTTDGTYIYFGNIEWFERVVFGGDGLSRIYRVGTGSNGTVEGQFYGAFSNFYDKISNTLVYHSDGYVYIPTENAYQLTRISVTTAAIDTVAIPPGLLRWENSTITDGPVLLTSDGQYFYNLTLRDSIGNRIYKLRILDPANGFALAKPDMILSGTSYEGFSGFFVHGDYIYVVESLDANFMRRIRLSDGVFEEEWIAVQPFQSYFAWYWDWQNDKVYASVYRRTGFTPKFSKFAGYHIDASGNIATNSVGPVAWWNELEYDLNNPSPTGEYSADLLGLNTVTRIWDTLQVNIPSTLSLSNIKADDYTYLKVAFELSDSSFETIEPMELKSVNFNYQPLADIYFDRDDLYFTPDSLLQGFPITMKFKSRNIGDLPADSLNLNFYFNGLDSLIYQTILSVPADSVSDEISYVMETDGMLFENEIKVLGEQNNRELFYFNNLIDKTFYVARDSLRPLFSVTFDGQEIIDGDIVSSEPEVIITLEDNSPLPLDTSYFTIVHNNIPMHFSSPDIEYDYVPYPNSKATIYWTPTLDDGRHTLEILAKDASGNFFDSTSFRSTFNVFTDNNLTDVYNYPNPFASETHFTFQLRGSDTPEEFLIRVYTIAGRLIRDISIPSSELQRKGFYKIPWNGRDQDGDEIGNGVYFYKVIAKFPDKTKSITQKLAKVK